MSDLLCRVCGEPWSAWGANHGDMAAWEYKLFCLGKGCPSCLGYRPEGLDPEEANLDRARALLLDGPDDPDAFGLATCDLDPLPAGDGSEWIEPEPEVLWTCAGCGYKVVRSNEAPLDGGQVSQDPIFLERRNENRHHYYKGKPEPEPDFTLDFGDGAGPQPFCQACACSCAECGTTILIGLAHSNLIGDTYDVGASFQNPDNPFHGSVCIDCLERMESENSEPGDSSSCL